MMTDCLRLANQSSVVGTWWANSRITPYCITPSWTELINGERKNSSKMNISQIFNPDLQIGKQKVTESKRFRPKRRADKKRMQISGTTELSDKQNVWAGLAGGGRTRTTGGPAGGHTGDSGSADGRAPATPSPSTTSHRDGGPAAARYILLPSDSESERRSVTRTRPRGLTPSESDSEWVNFQIAHRSAARPAAISHSKLGSEQGRVGDTCRPGRAV
jgi:hypothetical protein